MGENMVICRNCNVEIGNTIESLEEHYYGKTSCFGPYKKKIIDVSDHIKPHKLETALAYTAFGTIIGAFVIGMVYIMVKVLH